MPSTVLGSTQCLIYVSAHPYKIKVLSKGKGRTRKEDNRLFSSETEIQTYFPTSQVYFLTPAFSCLALQQAAAFASCHESHGVCVIVGLLKFGVQLNISGWLFFSGRTLKGSVFGGMDETGKSGNLWDFGCGIIEKCVINA